MSVQLDQGRRPRPGAEHQPVNQEGRRSPVPGIFPIVARAAFQAYWMDDPGERSLLARGFGLDFPERLLREVQRLLSLVQRSLSPLYPQVRRERKPCVRKPRGRCSPHRSGTHPCPSPRATVAAGPGREYTYRMTADYSESMVRGHLIVFEWLERLRWRVSVDGRRLFTFCSRAVPGRLGSSKPAASALSPRIPVAPAREQ